MNYYVFVLGYDLLHDVLNGIACDEAYELCRAIYDDFDKSVYNNPYHSGYECLEEYVRTHMDEIKAKAYKLKNQCSTPTCSQDCERCAWAKQSMVNDTVRT